MMDSLSNVFYLKECERWININGMSLFLFNRVLQLMNLTDSCLPQGGCERRELATISFFEQFRKIYVGDQVHKTSKFYRRLSEILGLNDESMVLAVFVRKM